MNTAFPTTRHREAFSEAFSLVEVMLALGVVAFCIVALLGLMTVGVRTSRDSTDAVQAADIASMLVSLRSASPTNALPAAFPLPPLDSPAGGTAYLSPGGSIVPAAQAAYRLTYTVATNGGRFSSLGLLLSWPAPADPAGASPAAVKGRYELFTCIPLP